MSHTFFDDTVVLALAQLSPIWMILESRFTPDHRWMHAAGVMGNMSSTLVVYGGQAASMQILGDLWSLVLDGSLALRPAVASDFGPNDSTDDFTSSLSTRLLFLIGACACLCASSLCIRNRVARQARLAQRRVGQLPAVRAHARSFLTPPRLT